MMLLAIEIAGHVGPLFKTAAKAVADAKLKGLPINVDTLTSIILTSAEGWSPVIKGIRPLDDPETRRAGARFLAGVVMQVSAEVT